MKRKVANMLDIVNIGNARKGEYKKVIKEIYLKGKCPFCRENFKYHKKPILKKKGGWLLTEESWPYKNSLFHFLIIGEKHREEFSEVTNKDFESIAYLTCWAIRKHKIRGGVLAIRFGDSNFSGASVPHIHFHLISPQQDKRTKRIRPVHFPVG